MTAPDRIRITLDGIADVSGKLNGQILAPHSGTEYVRADLMQELIAAYEDIMDYGIVFAKKEQQDRLKAAKEKMNV